MSTDLPLLLDPLRASSHCEHYAGSLELQCCERLTSALARRDGVMEYQLAFGVDNDHRSVIKGWVKATLWLQCQRCLEPFPFPVHSTIALAVVKGLDEAERLPEVYDPVLIDDKPLRPQLLLEDELLLALPVVPRHADGMCQPPIDTQTKPPADERHPFADLAQWHAARRST